MSGLPELYKKLFTDDGIILVDDDEGLSNEQLTSLLQLNQTGNQRIMKHPVRKTKVISTQVFGKGADANRIKDQIYDYLEENGYEIKSVVFHEDGQDLWSIIIGGDKEDEIDT